MKLWLVAVFFLTGCSFDFDLGHLKIGRSTSQPIVASDDDYESEMQRGQLELARLEIRNAQLRRVLNPSVAGYSK